MKNNQAKTKNVKNPSKTSITVEKCIKTEKNTQKPSKIHLKKHQKPPKTYEKTSKTRRKT